MADIGGAKKMKGARDNRGINSGYQESFSVFKKVEKKERSECACNKLAKKVVSTAAYNRGIEKVERKKG